MRLARFCACFSTAREPAIPGKFPQHFHHFALVPSNPPCRSHCLLLVFVLFVLLGPEFADLHLSRAPTRGHSIFIFQCLYLATHSACLLVLFPPLFVLPLSLQNLPMGRSPSRRHAPSSLCSCPCLCPTHTTFNARAMVTTAAARGFVARRFAATIPVPAQLEKTIFGVAVAKHFSGVG